MFPSIPPVINWMMMFRQGPPCVCQGFTLTRGWLARGRWRTEAPYFSSMHMMDKISLSSIKISFSGWLQIIWLESPSGHRRPIGMSWLEEHITSLKKFLELREDIYKGQVKWRENTRFPESLVLYRTFSNLGYSHSILKSILLVGLRWSVTPCENFPVTFYRHLDKI